MKAASVAVALLALAAVGPVSASRRAVEPLGKALQLLESFGEKVRTTGEAEDKAHEDLAAWCEDASKTAGAEAQALAARKEELQARIAKAASDADAAASKIESDASVEQTEASEKEHSDNVGRKADLEQKKAHAEGDLAATSKSLGGAQELFDGIKQSCTSASVDHEATVKARSAELTAIGVVLKTLAAISGPSMLMLDKESQSGSRAQVGSDPTGGRKATEIVSKLAYGKHSFSDLSQLASNMDAVVRLGEYTGEDVFSKIKTMLTDMIARMQRQSQMDVSEKEFCDEQLAKNKEKNSDLEDEMTRRSGKIDEASANAAELAEDIKDAQTALAFLAQISARLLAIRQNGHAAYAATKDLLDSGMHSVGGTITVIRSYTAGGGKDVRAQLEEVESRIAMHMTAVNLEEDGLASGSDALSQAISVAKATKEQDVKYMTRERGDLERSLTETQADAGSTGEELRAVKDFQTQLKHKCVAQPSSYEERRKARETEIAGLKEALAVLEGEAIALVQRGKRGLRQAPLDFK